MSAYDNPTVGGNLVDPVKVQGSICPSFVAWESIERVSGKKVVRTAACNEYCRKQKIELYPHVRNPGILLKRKGIWKEQGAWEGESALANAGIMLARSCFIVNGTVCPM